jgi:rhodanese-related sulfurtransferase
MGFAVFPETFLNFGADRGIKMKSIVFIFFLILGNVLSGQVPDSLKYISLGPREFQEAYNEHDPALLIDVREFFEYKKSRLKNALNIPSSGDLELAADTLNKGSHLFLYCTSGFRSKRVAKFFYDKGFLKAYSLDGGINAWKKEGMAIDKKRLKASEKKTKDKSHKTKVISP